MLEILNTLFASNGFVPHGHCYLWKPGLVSLHVLSDSLIALAYASISVTLIYLVRRTRLPFHGTFLAFGLFIAACGVTHAVGVWTLWHPIYWFAGLLKAITALASVITALWLPPLVPEVVSLVQSAKVAEERRLQLEEANHELEALYQRVKGLDQLKTQFFTNVSHELRTPLTLLLGPAERLLTQTKLTPVQRQNVEQIDRNAHTLLKYVNDLLDIAKLEVNQMGVQYTSFDLVQLVRLVTAHFESIPLGRQVTLRVDTPSTLWVQADAEKLQRVLFNLLANAFRFTPVGGEVHCKLEQQGQEVVLIVQDNGPGVPLEQRQVIFERFQQAQQDPSQRSGGTGLGLAIAKEFVELHRGNIAVEESPGGGALFRIQIPIAAPADAELQTESFSPSATAAIARQSLAALQNEDLGLTSTAPVLAGISSSELDEREDRPLVLLVEDNLEMSQFIASVLAAEYRVVVAGNGQEGWEQAIALKPDLILTDMMMPIMDGEQLVQAIRTSSELDGIPLIVLTAKADDQLRVRMLQEGVQDYVMKPFAADELRVRVQNLIGMKQVREVLQQELTQQQQNLLTVSNTATLRKQELQSALTALRQSDARFRRVFESSLIGILFWDTSGTITDANDTFLQTFGYTQADLQSGLTWATLTPEGHSVLDGKILIESGEAAVFPSFEQELICKNGNYVPVLVGVARLEDSSEQGVAFVLDITQRKQAEVALQKANDELERRVEQRTQELVQTNLWLQEQIVERQKVEADLRISRESIQVLYEVVADQELSFTEKIQRLLGLGCQRYQLEVGILAQVTGDRYEVIEAKLCPEYLTTQGEAQQVGLPAIARGDVFELNQTYCRETLQASEPVSFECAGRSSQWQGHPCYLATQLEAYIATPIRVSGEIYGTLGFSSPQPHNQLFTTGDKKFLQLMAEWIGGEIARQRAEEALVQEQEFLKVLLDNLNVGIVACDAEGVLTLFNQATREFHGLPEEPISSLDWAQHYNLYHVDGKTPMQLEEVPLYRAWQGERVHNQEMMIVSKQGNARTLLASGQAIIDPDGQRLGAVVVMHDITERKQAEDRLRQSESTLRSFYNSASMMMGVVELIGDEDILHVSDNPATAHFFGLTTLTPHWRASERNVAHPYLQTWIHHYQQAEKTQSPVRFEYCHRTEQGEKWLSVTVCFITVSPNGRSRFAYVVEDISDRKQAEAQIRTLNAELEQRVIERTAQLETANRAKDELLVREQQARAEAEAANRMKDEFLATLSHELRTPLNAILGWAQLLRTRTFDPETITRALETIERNARAQTQLVGDILDVSRIVQGNLRLNIRSVLLIAVIEAALDAVRPAADAKGIQIRADYDRAISTILGDPDRLQQVVWNLLSNAIKFTPRGGLVEVSLEDAPEGVSIRVQDNGQGIEAEFLPHVFDRFRQADSSISRAHGGLGLGLAIVRHLIELHGGTVAVASDGLGLGATFVVTLPGGRPEGMPESGGEQAEPSTTRQMLFSEPQDASQILAHTPSLSGLRVLVVEDEADTRDFLQTLLEHSQAEVFTAASVKAAIEILTSETIGGWPDVLVSDVGMPEEDGYDLIRRVQVIAQEQQVQLPTIALTAYASANDQARLLQAGFHVHLPKPVDSAELVTVIATLVGRLDTHTPVK